MVNAGQELQWVRELSSTVRVLDVNHEHQRPCGGRFERVVLIVKEQTTYLVASLPKPFTRVNLFPASDPGGFCATYPLEIPTHLPIPPSFEKSSYLNNIGALIRTGEQLTPVPFYSFFIQKPILGHP